MTNVREHALSASEIVALRKVQRIVDAFRDVDRKLPVSYVAAFLAVAMEPLKGPTHYAQRLGSIQPVISRHLLEIGPKARHKEEPLRLVDKDVSPTSLRDHEYFLTPKGRTLLAKLLAILEDRVGENDRLDQIRLPAEASTAPSSSPHSATENDLDGARSYVAYCSFTEPEQEGDDARWGTFELLMRAFSTDDAAATCRGQLEGLYSVGDHFAAGTQFQIDDIVEVKAVPPEGLFLNYNNFSGDVSYYQSRLPFADEVKYASVKSVHLELDDGDWRPALQLPQSHPAATIPQGVQIPEVPQRLGDFQKLCGIPVPEGRAPRGSKYGWDELKINESFFVAGGKPDTFNTLTSTRNKNEKTKNGEKAKKFIARKYTHEGVTGVMVWRVA